MSKEKQADILIIAPPARAKRTQFPPYGAMYVAGFLRHRGYRPQILNIQTTRITNSEVVERIKKINPDYIGFSGIVSTSYKYIKALSFELKQNFPDKPQILGGSLSNAAVPVLENTAIDIVVHGEGEETACELIKCLDEKKDLACVRGIYYKKGSSCVYTGDRALIRDLDTVPYPAFDLVDMDHYFGDGPANVAIFTREIKDKRIYDRKRKRKQITIVANRGCIGTCAFCVRTDRGLRMPSLKYLFDFIEYCVKEFNVGFFTFGDECFAPSKEKNWQFIEEYKKRKLDIMFRIMGLRVHTVDRDILRAYKEIGCWMINYGFESGSQKMLNIIDKRVTVEQNRNAALWTREAGIYTPPQLILGMPGETDLTIQKTIDFLKSLNFGFKQYKWTHALPFPGSPLYDYARLTGAIENEDKYLTSLGDIEGTPIFHINVTDEEDSAVASWPEKIKREIDRHYFYRKYGIRNRIARKAMHFLETMELHIRRGDLLTVARVKIRLFLYTVFNMRQKKKVIQKKHVRFKKRKDINIEKFLREADYSAINRKIALKKINQKLIEKNEN